VARARGLPRAKRDGYEVLDTKLARHMRPVHALQLCFYTEESRQLHGGMRPRTTDALVHTHARTSQWQGLPATHATERHLQDVIDVRD
jgi:hypothetical protein